MRVEDKCTNDPEMELPRYRTGGVGGTGGTGTAIEGAVRIA